jgi:hypothetical protein
MTERRAVAGGEALNGRWWRDVRRLAVAKVECLAVERRKAVD